MNLKLVDSLVAIINSLTPEEKQALGSKVNLTNSNNEGESQSWHEFIEETYGSIEDETFMRQPQGEFEKRELF